MPVSKYEFTSSNELIQQRQQQVQKSLDAARTPGQMKAALGKTLMNAVFKSKEVTQARETENLVKEINSRQKPEGMDELDWQIKQAKDMQQRAASINPDIAMQANQNILALTREKKQQDRLKSADERAIALHDYTIKKHQAQNTPVIMKKVNGQWQQWDIGEEGDFEGHMGVLRQLQEEDPSAEYDMALLSDSFDIEDDGPTAANPTPFSKSYVTKGMEAIESQTLLMDGMIPLVNQLAADPDALDAVKMDANGDLQAGPYRQAVEDFMATGRQIANAWQATEDQFGIEVDGQIIRNVDAFVDKKLKEMGISSQVAKSRVLDLAYIWARSRDPGGRLSDQDVEMAVKAITGGGGLRPFLTRVADQMRNSSQVVRAKINALGKFDVLSTELIDQYNDNYNALAVSWEEADKVARERDEGFIPGENSDPVPSLPNQDKYSKKWGLTQ